jgi:cation diffusion facilitator CzcD-associated flavoprotein CzcO
MAKDAAHVTMLQRSPTYIVSLPGRDPLADLLRRVLPPRAVYPFVKWKNVLLTSLSYRVSKRWPHVMKGLIRKGLERQLPADYDIDTHFTPRYNPWDQRLCVVPDGDLFKAIARGHASVVTDRVKTFTETGIELESGACLDADVVVTATGLNMLANGGMQLVVDGHEVDASRTVAYKGMMFSGVPNFAIAVGYTNASWTLKCDLVCRHVMRLLDHMDAHGHRMVVPRWSEPELPDQPLLDLTSGYVLRSIDKFPKQGRRAPWRLYQNYLRDLLLLRFGSVEDEALEFSRGGGATSAPRRLTA